MLDFRKLKADDDYGVFMGGAYLGTVTKADAGWVAVTSGGKRVGDRHETRDCAGHALENEANGGQG